MRKFERVEREQIGCTSGEDGNAPSRQEFRGFAREGGIVVEDEEPLIPEEAQEAILRTLSLHDGNPAMRLARKRKRESFGAPNAPPTPATMPLPGGFRERGAFRPS